MTRALAVALVATLATAPAAADDALDVAAATTPPRFVDAGPPRVHARERLAEIQRRIQAALRYPPLAREREQQGTTLLRFDIDADGAPRNLVVHASSGLAALDRAATVAVAAAAPLPWVYGRLEVPVLFSLERRK